MEPTPVLLEEPVSDACGRSVRTYAAHVSLTTEKRLLPYDKENDYDRSAASTDPAPQEKIDRVIAEIKAQREHDLRAARKVRRWISWTARLVIVLAAVSFVLSIVATKFGIPSYTVTILVTLTAGLEWLRQNRG